MRSRRSLLARTMLGAVAMLLVAAAPAAHAKVDAMSAHQFAFTSITGEPMPMSRFAGKAVLLVNTASRCGFTHQYEGLQTLYDRYKDRGLVVLGVPSNDFGGQEPGSEAEIKQFCEATFGITFPMTEKQHVRGAAAHPLYKWLEQRMGAAARPGWNFHKILLGPDGAPITAWSTGTGPLSASVTSGIEKALPN